MSKKCLNDIAHARSGDKGNSVNIGLFAQNEEAYEAISAQITPDKVKAFFGELVEGKVIRYDVPNILGFNFICYQALNGGGSSSMRLDNLGKCFGANLLRMEIDYDISLLEKG